MPATADMNAARHSLCCRCGVQIAAQVGEMQTHFDGIGVNLNITNEAAQAFLVLANYNVQTALLHYAQPQLFVEYAAHDQVCRDHIGPSNCFLEGKSR